MALPVRKGYKGAPAEAVLTNSPTSGDTSFVVDTVSGWSTTFPYYCVVEPGTSKEEKVKVTAISTLTLTVVRAQDDTTASGHNAGAAIYPVFTADEADEANEIASVMTTKGDLIGTDGSSINRLGVGTNTHVLQADSTATNGFKWGQVATAGIADSAITSAKILDATIVVGDIADGAITSAKILDGTIVAGDIADGAITVGKLAAGVRNLTETEFTSSNASYTIPSGVTGIWALCVGSGGGGGSTSTATALNCGGGGGAGQAKEKFFVISGDTTLNITVPAGGAGGTAGGKGSSGSAATIVGNTSVTTYLSAAGGGGGGGGAAANVTGISGASGGGNGATTSQQIGGGGGGMASSAANSNRGPFGSILTSIGGGATATSITETGYDGGSALSPTGARTGGMGLFIFGRGVCVGGSGGAASSHTHFGGAASVGVDATPTSATANTGAGGNGAATSLSTSYAGGNGGSGLVVLRYVY